MEKEIKRPTLEISTRKLIDECAKDKRQAEALFNTFRSINTKNVHDIFKYRKFGDDFTSRLSCFNEDGEYILGTIRPNYNEFIIKVCRFLELDITSDFVDDENLTKRLLERVERLKQVTSEQELELEFPLLYRDLYSGRSYMSTIEKRHKSGQMTDEAYADAGHYFYGCAMKKGLDNFVKTQAEMYKRFITKRDKYKEKIHKTSYNALIRKYFDMDKVYMYAIHEYLRVCEGINDVVEIRKYISIIEKYLDNKVIGKQCEIVVDGLVVNLQTIMTRLKNIKDRVNDNNNIVDWVLIPEGRDYSRVRKTPSEPRETLFNEAEIMELRRLGEQRRTFYEGTPYYAKAVGLQRYKGYIAYIYQNGQVILDKEYNEENPRIIYGNAIYNLKIGDFETLSKLDKTTLKNNPKVRKKSHTKNWMQFVNDIVATEATDESKEEVERLVQKLKRK